MFLCGAWAWSSQHWVHFRVTEGLLTTFVLSPLDRLKQSLRRMVWASVYFQLPDDSVLLLGLRTPSQIPLCRLAILPASAVLPPGGPGQCPRALHQSTLLGSCVASAGWAESDKPSADRWTPPYPAGPAHTPPGHPWSKCSYNQLLTPAAHPSPGHQVLWGREVSPSEPATHPDTRRSAAPWERVWALTHSPGFIPALPLPDLVPFPPV